MGVALKVTRVDHTGRDLDARRQARERRPSPPLAWSGDGLDGRPRQTEGD